MFKISMKVYTVAASILVFSSNASSKEISYDYVQGTYSSITESSLGIDVDGNGFAAAGSFSISPNIAISASYGVISFDRVLGIDVDASELDFGITAHASIAPHTDVFGNFSVINAEVEVSDGFTTISDDDTGNSISVGIRYMATDSTEINLGFSRADVFDDTANTFGIGVILYANEKFSIGIGYSTGDDIDTLLLSARIDIKQ